MRNTLTLQDACIALDIDQTTLYRWLQRAHIEPKSDVVDKRKRVLSRAQVQELARMHGRSLHGFTDTEALQVQDKRIAALEDRVSELENLVQHMKQDETLHKQMPRTLRPARPAYIAPSDAPEDLSAGSTQFYAFAARHGVNRRTFLDQMLRGQVHYIERPKAGRAGEVERWLTPAAQGDAITFWRTNGTPYSECDACPHDGS